MQIKTGPVLGRATPTTAVVWVEWHPLEEAPSLVLGDGRAVTLERIPTHPAAGIFRIEGLAPHSTVSYTFRPTDPRRPGPFFARSSSDTMSEGAVAIVSCNRSQLYRADPALGDVVWNDLYDQLVPQKISAVFHVGDQIYADEVWDAISTAHLERVSRQPLPKVAIEKWCRENQASWRELYRRLYRDAWRPDRAIAKVLAAVPNLMMWDDHDIHDGYGSRPFDPYIPYSRIAHVARQAYQEYQHPLNTGTTIPADGTLHWLLRWPGIECFALDLRTDRCYDANPSRMVGEAQWRELSAWSASRPPHDPDDPTTWGAITLLVASTPPVMFGNTDAAPFIIVPDLVDDLRDQWIHGANTRDLNRFLKFCDQLQHTKHTAVVILAGDIHINHLVRCTRRSDRHLVLHQITSSPVGNTPVSGALRKLIYDHATLRGLTHKKSAYEGEIVADTLIDRRGYAILRWSWQNGRAKITVHWRTLFPDGSVRPSREIELGGT